MRLRLGVFAIMLAMLALAAFAAAGPIWPD